MNTNLGKALLEIQQDAPALQKNAINPHFRNRYVSLDSLLEQILPVLNRHGVVLLQQPTHVPAETGPVPALTTTLIHASSGELIRDTMLLVLDKENPQAQGSALTYARRYALMAGLGLVADQDDDAQAASRPRSRGDEGTNGSTFVAPEQRKNREQLLAEFKELQPQLARKDQYWTKDSILSHASAQTGDSYKEFENLPTEALQQLVDAGRQFIRGPVAA